jgi:tetratricopeptide (TPR) repeat protein
LRFIPDLYNCSISDCKCTTFIDNDRFINKKMKLFSLVFFIILVLPFHSFCQNKEQADTLNPDEAIKNYQSILNRNKHSSYALYGLAATYFIKKDYGKSLKFSKNNINEPNDYRAESFILYASSLDRMGRLTEAIAVYEKAIKLYPDNYQMWYQYSLSCYKDRNYKKSISAIGRAIELQPLFTPAHYLYGCLLFESSNDQRCVSAFLFALMLDNDSLRSRQVFAFVNEYLKQKMSGINIPFFDTRLAITTVDNVLYYYISKETSDRIFAGPEYENFCGMISDYLTSAKEFTVEYRSFYYSLRDNGFCNVFSHYVMRTSNNEYINKWYIFNKDQLDRFADFLNKNLPGK